MAVKVAINGFGRIGRNVARAILERSDHDLELVSINDLGDAKANARLLRHDSVHGAFNGSVEVDGNDLIINGKRIQVTAERDPAALPHAANGIDSFGASAPIEDLFKHFGLTADAIAPQILERLNA